MIIPINWLNYYVVIYRYMKMTYHNHDMEDYIDYHDRSGELSKTHAYRSHGGLLYGHLHFSFDCPEAWWS